jgi:hypothetical protein
MRIQNKEISVRSVLFSRVFGLVYFLLAGFFIYKSYSLFPIWSGHYEKNIAIKEEYGEKEIAVRALQEKKENNETDLGKARYEKEFFNKLDEGEEMIVLYEGEVGKTGQEKNGQNAAVSEEKERHMFFWEKWHQATLVWWKNLR